ncbi:MAG: flagellar hook-associated protein FlgL [Desulfobacterales bacterium]|nr:flagellar hook-associated protein FlgL [Desulfobacterales bacterium]
MRVANKTIYDMIKFNLSSTTEELNKANEVVATGKRITDLSDDPVGLTQVLNIKSSLSNIEQMGCNIAIGKSWLTASESALTNVQNMISDTKALCVQMATATMSAAGREAAAKTVQNTLEEMVSLANTDVNGRYVFAGSKTNATAFTLAGSSVTYNGDNTAFTIKIGRDATIQVGSDGEAVFQSPGNDIFTTLKDLKSALEGDDVDGIQAAIGELGSCLDHISAKISDVGSKMNRMEIKGNILQDMNITNTERLSKIEDADITEAIMDLKVKEVAYQAALAASAKMLRVSLVDYL